MKRNKKGFTLIELLAVIVILAIIALIAVPVIMNIIDKANKSAFKDTAYGIISAGELYFAERQLDLNGMIEEKTFIFPTNEIDIKGEVPAGTILKVNTKGQISLVTSNGRYCITKGYEDTDVTVTEGVENCKIKFKLTQNAINSFNSILNLKKYIPLALNKIVDENGNVPAYNYYNDIRSRSIKELKAYDDKIFMGIGDWDNNTGPVKIIYYDTLTEKIVTSGTINDEAVESFTIIDNKLYTTGTDPRSNWGYGSYYVYNNENNNWAQHQFNDGWIHVFDIEEFNDKIFMCGSTTESMKRSAVQVSYDNGKTFQDVKLVKDGEQLPYHSSLRFYAFEKYNGKFYAYSYFNQDGYDTRGIYIYDEENNQFNFIRMLGASSINKEYGLYESRRYNVIHFKNNTVFKDYFVYLTGTIIAKTKDMNNFDKILTNTKDVIQDVVVHDDTLYTLSYQFNEDKTFSTRIYSTRDLENFELVYEFKIDSFPFSIEYHNNKIYIGTSYDTSSKDYIDYESGLKTNSETGSLYIIDLDKTTRNLNLDEENKVIEISTNGMTYPVNYNLSDYDITFTTTLTFDNNMTKNEWQQEFSKIQNLDLLYTLVKNASKNNFDNLISDFDAAINNISLEQNYSNAIEFSDAIFSDDLNVVDENFSIYTENIIKNNTKHEILVTLKITY